MGGQGSGNFGHAGRPGEVGGSASEGGGEKPYFYKSVNQKCEIASELPLDDKLCPYRKELESRALQSAGQITPAVKELDALDRWKGTGYLSVDHYLRSKAGEEDRSGWYDKNTFQDKERAQEFVNTLDQVMEHSKTEEDVTVYRGMSVRMAHKLDVEGGYKNPSFTSTSLKLGAALGFSEVTPAKDECVMMIKVPKGTPAYYYGTKDHEAELLLPRDLSLKVTGITTYNQGIHEKVSTPYVGDGGENDFEGAITVYTMEIQK